MTRRAPGVILLAVLSLLSWTLAAWLVLSAAQPAEAARVRSVSTAVLQPTGAGWERITFYMLLLDDGSIPFEDAAAAARAAAIARVPGGIELQPVGVSAQFVPLEASWSENTVSWNYNAANAPAELGNVFPLFAASAASWNQAGNADWRFQSPGTTGAPASVCDGNGDGQNSVTWGTWPSASVLAVTCIRGNESLIEFDMLFVIDRAWTIGDEDVRVDLQSVATHEFGHALGLNHSADLASVMVTNYRPGRIRREPQADDIAGLVAIYGLLPTAAPAATATPSETPRPPATPTYAPTSSANDGATPALDSTPSPTAAAPTSVPGTPPVPPSPPNTTTPAPGASPSESPSPTPTAQSPNTEPATHSQGRLLVPGLSRN